MNPLQQVPFYTGIPEMLAPLYPLLCVFVLHTQGSSNAYDVKQRKTESIVPKTKDENKLEFLIADLIFGKKTAGIGRPSL